MDMLVAGETVIPGTDREPLIEAPVLYSHEWDVAKALTERLAPAWRKRNYAAAAGLAGRCEKCPTGGIN